MRPIILKGHERSITYLKFNREGDLLFTCSKDKMPCVWWAHNGERIGNYRGHNGTVWSLDVSFDSSRLLTGSADNTVRLWDVQHGRSLYSFRHVTPVRSVQFAEGDRLFMSVTDQVLGQPATVLLYKLTDDLDDQYQYDKPLRDVVQSSTKIQRALFGPLNLNIYTAGEDGCVYMYDTETGKQLGKMAEHRKGINDIAFAPDFSCLITASSDNTAKLLDPKTLKVLKTYETDRPVNAAAISPLMEHVVIGGGQEADSVTTTSTRVGNFQSRLFHKIFQEELGLVKGHFGPIHTLSFTPDGRGFASGAEDGTVRLHRFDDSYFELFNEDLIDSVEA